MRLWQKRQKSSCAYLTNPTWNYSNSSYRTSRAPLDIADSRCPVQSAPRWEGTCRHKVFFVRRFYPWTRILSNLSLAMFIGTFGRLRSRNFPAWIWEFSRCFTLSCWMVFAEVILCLFGVFTFIFKHFFTLIFESSFCWGFRLIFWPYCAGIALVIRKFCFPIVWDSLSCFYPLQMDTCCSDSSHQHLHSGTLNSRWSSFPWSGLSMTCYVGWCQKKTSYF